MERYILRDIKVYKNLINYLDGLNKSKLYEVTIKLFKDKRSLNQNAYFHKLVDIIANYTGHTAEDMKDIIKIQQLGYDEISFRGKEFVRPRKTSELKVEEMADLITATLALGMELGLIMPDAQRYGYKI